MKMIGVLFRRNWSYSNEAKIARILRLAVIVLTIFRHASAVAVESSKSQPPSGIFKFASNPAGKLFRKDKAVVVAKAAGNEIPTKTLDASENSLYASFIVPLLAGGAATAFGDLAVHPLDTIKTVQQAAGAASERSTFLGACRGIFADNGLPGFYKGVGPFVLLDGLAGCVKFATYEVCKKFAAKVAPEQVKPYSHFAAAAVAFFACSIVLVPGELLKQTLQAGTYPSLLACISGVYKNSGFRGFYQGLYDNAKRTISSLMGSPDGRSNNQLELLAAAMPRSRGVQLVGGFTGYITNPLDIVKTRLMTTAFPAGMRRPSVFKVFADMWVKEGPRGLMAGSVVRACWLIPFTAIYLPAYDEAKRWLLSESAARRRAAGGRSADTLIRVPD